MEHGALLVVDADDNERDMIAAVMARLGRHVHQVTDAAGTLAHVVERQPDLVLLDLESGGLELCHELSERNIPVIVLSAARTQPADTVAGLLAGADDYINKPYDADELLARSRRTLNRSAPRTTTSAHRVLSTRELEVLASLSEGLTQRQIATQLVISDKTVATHIQHILAKLGVHSRAQAVAIANSRTREH